jgi:hypothetical protein
LNVKKTAFLLIITIAFLAGRVRPAEALTPSEAALAAEAAPRVLSLAGDVAQVTCAAGELLYLPLGTGEVMLSPLPGISFGSGITHVGKGLLAPFKLGIAVLRLPVSIIKNAGALLHIIPAAEI